MTTVAGDPSTVPPRPAAPTPPRWRTTAIAGLALLLTRAPAHGWGCPAHELTAKIAASRLSPATAVAITDLLDGAALEDVACWADDIRPSHPETKRWHYVDIPRDASSYRPSRDCAVTPEGDCVVAALERATATLRRADAPRAERAEALRYLVHFVGDLHQPLHCADDGDRGGNGVAVTMDGSGTNLHAVWDTALLAQARHLDHGFTRRLTTAGRTAPPLTTIDYPAWAVEGHGVAVTSVYGDLPAEHALDDRYVTAHADVLARQLLRAGARLGDVLNLVFTGTPTAVAAPTAPAKRSRRAPCRGRRRCDAAD